MEIVCNNIPAAAIIVSIIILLNAIGRDSIFRFIRNVIRGAYYIVLILLAAYVIKYYWSDVLFRANRLWLDAQNILGEILT
jgi:hypothetical protein